MEIGHLIEKYREYTRDARRYLHAHPELSNKEFETTKYIARELDSMGIPYKINESTGTGLVGIIEGAYPGKSVALRADMDALNVTEANTFDFASKTPGVMHACGHDGHMAILLGASKMLMEVRDHLHGKVYLVFQPAEELGSGAKEMIEFGDWFKDVDNVFGAHVWSPLEAGKFSVEPGERLAAADIFTIEVIGKSGHGSAPHETIDAVVVASAIVMNLQTLVSRTYDPLDSVAVTVGSFHSGTRFNIIAGDAVLTGTTRYFTHEIAGRIESDLRRVVENTAKAYGAKVNINYEYVVPPTYNETDSAILAEEAVIKLFGREALAKTSKVTGAEDFAFYTKYKPGCFAFIGIQNPDVGACYPHHNEHFNMDDEVLSKGSALYAQYAIDFLEHSREEA